MGFKSVMVTAILVLICRMAWAAESSPATRPSTQPSTRPDLPDMTSVTDKAVGLTFDRPTTWKEFNAPPNGQARIAFAEVPPWQGGVQAYMQIYMEDTHAIATVDTRPAVNSTAVLNRVFNIDGMPAIETVISQPTFSQSVPAETLIVETAKGSRFYALNMVFATSQQDKYLKLADAICASMKLQ
jgi:hypothetical protein